MSSILPRYIKPGLNSTMIYLYVKTHTLTGLKYLGKTTSADPHKYRGSGKYWKSHIKAHGYSVTTEIIKECVNENELKYWGNYYSELWDVVNSNLWANLKPEAGDGGAIIHSIESNQKRSNTLTGRVFTNEHRKNLSKSNKGHKDYRTDEVKAIASKKASSKLKGKKKPIGFGEAVGNRRRGKQSSENTIKKLKESWTDERRLAQAERTRIQNQTRPDITCPHCGFIGKNIGNMNRYHFTNCKCLQVVLN